MGELKKYTITLNGSKYPITAEDSEEYIRKIEFYLNSRIEKSKDKSGMLYSDAITLAILSIDVADTLFKTQEQLSSLKADSKQLIEQFDKLSGEYDSAMSEIKSLEDQIAKLREKIIILKMGGKVD
ncbi:MAG: cell division protein ZapA [Clostridia bacterium]|nr:cell division protein ZapA [Clostridia bacterium]MCR5694133.1 cell division protein ZapA [Clostridia bacterium]